MVEILFRKMDQSFSVFHNGIKQDIEWTWLDEDSKHVYTFSNKRHCERFAGQRTFAYED